MMWRAALERYVSKTWRDFSSTKLTTLFLWLLQRPCSTEVTRTSRQRDSFTLTVLAGGNKSMCREASADREKLKRRKVRAWRPVPTGTKKEKHVWRDQCQQEKTKKSTCDETSANRKKQRNKEKHVQGDQCQQEKTKKQEHVQGDQCQQEERKARSGRPVPTGKNRNKSTCRETSANRKKEKHVQGHQCQQEKTNTEKLVQEDHCRQEETKKQRKARSGRPVPRGRNKEKHVQGDQCQQEETKAHALRETSADNKKQRKARAGRPVPTIRNKENHVPT